MMTYKNFYLCCRGRSHQLIKKLTLKPTFSFVLLLLFENIEDEVITLADGKTANYLCGAALAGTGISGTDDKQCAGLNKICEGWIGHPCCLLG